MNIYEITLLCSQIYIVKLDIIKLRVNIQSCVNREITAGFNMRSMYINLKAVMPRCVSTLQCY